jgi:hypothetical protein
MKEDVLRLLRSHAVALPVLMNVGFVPVKPSGVLKGIWRRHIPKYTTNIYTEGELRYWWLRGRAGGVETWAEMHTASRSEQELAALRKCTYLGRRSATSSS